MEQNKSSKRIAICVIWHKACIILGQCLGIYISYATAFDDFPNDNLKAMFMGTAVIVLGTFCFMLVPLLFCLLSAAIRFLPTLGVGIYCFMWIANILGDHHDISFKIFGLSAAATIWGVFNIYTAFYASKEENFNIITYFKS